MRKFAFCNCYSEELWEGYEKNGLIKEHFGIRFPQSIYVPEDKKFNELAKKGGKLYNLVKDKKCVFYIDRLQGGFFMSDYVYDKELLKEYNDILGDDFLGLQMHEWLSNYCGDLNLRLWELPEEKWTPEEIRAEILKKYPLPHVFIESMTVEEMAAAGKPKNHQEFYDNMTAIYKKRVATYGKLVPCDAAYIMYPFEAEHGAKSIMPELGAQTPNMRIQMCFARGVTNAYGIKLGAYYEPWGGDMFNACSFIPEEKNEWYLKGSADFPFTTGGPNGGSSRSLQKRTYLYAYLSGAEFISEEWGGYNTFEDLKTYKLSEYGLIKKEFLDFVDKYPDIGEKVAPIATVLSNDLLSFILYNDYKKNYGGLFGYKIDGKIKEDNRIVQFGVAEIFANPVEMEGNEKHVLINSEVPDAVDMLNEGDGKALEKYQYLVNMTLNPEFSKKHANCIEPAQVKEKLNEILPCKVNGGFHYLLNRKGENGYYLSIFNHSGIQRTQKDGDVILPSATKTAEIELKDGRILKALEGNKDVKFKDGKYYVTLKGGDWLFAEI